MPDDQETLFESQRFRVVRATHPDLPDRDVIRHPGAVTILPLVDDDHVCLIKNYRLSVDEVLIELPAGTIDPPEAPRETAERELAEETGYRAERIELLHSFFLSPGILDEKMHLFAATQLTAGPTAHEADERMENYVVSWTEAMRMIDQGKICDAKTIVGLTLYNRTRRTNPS